jgi:2,5-diamino-6-(ribosylamino)-4(3H)-pyrimidinone 5'-phosphate reductase
MKPRVIVYNAISLDGQTTGFPVDLGLFYGLAGRWHESVSLAGCDTLLSFPPEVPPETTADLKPLPVVPGDDRSILAVPDSRGRLKRWHFLRAQPHWRDFISLCSDRTPPDHLEYLRARGIHVIKAGTDHVDLARALEELATHFGAKVVRIDSGGVLNSVMLRAGLVDEVHVLVHPVLAGQSKRRGFFEAADGLIELIPTGVEKLDHGLVLLSYRVG